MCMQIDNVCAWPGALKALCHYNYKVELLLNELISSKIQLKWVQEVWARPVSQYSVREFTEIERMQCKDFVEVEWRSS